MAYEKLLNEIYAALSLQYLWPKYEPAFVKSESPDWTNSNMDFGLEVSQALLPEDGQAASFLEQYLGCLKEDLPELAFSKYGDRLYFYNDRFWAILPKKDEAQDYIHKAEFRFDRKLEKLNSNYRVCKQNGLYLFLHPEERDDVGVEQICEHMKRRQQETPDHFDWVFLNCASVIHICDLNVGNIEEIPILESTRTFLAVESERLRHCRTWENGTVLELGSRSPAER